MNTVTLNSKKVSEGRYEISRNGVVIGLITNTGVQYIALALVDGDYTFVGDFHKMSKAANAIHKATK